MLITAITAIVVDLSAKRAGSKAQCVDGPRRWRWLNLVETTDEVWG